jgi:hypothetical protein
MSSAKGNERPALVAVEDDTVVETKKQKAEREAEEKEKAVVQWMKDQVEKEVVNKSLNPQDANNNSV